MALVNFEAVAAAAQTLQDAGQRPSVRAVIAHLGGGSPNAVLKFLAQWKTGGAGESGVAGVQVHSRIVDAPLAPASLEPGSRATVALASAQKRAAAFGDDLQAIADAHNLVEQQNLVLRAERDVMEQQLVSVTRQLEQAQAESDRHQQVAAEQAAALAKAEVRLEALPNLHVEIERLRSALNMESKARAVAELQAAVSEARLEVGERYAGATQARATQAEQQVAVAQARLESTARELADAKQSDAAKKKGKF
ncbi:MAG: DNA-binding protein [Bdellovibrionales bacterium]|nr:DNA-binding protein [Massilia sp.]